MSLCKWMTYEEKNTLKNLATAERMLQRNEKESKERMWSAVGIAFVSGVICGFGSGFSVGITVTPAFVIGTWVAISIKNEYIEKMLKNDLKHEPLSL